MTIAAHRAVISGIGESKVGRVPGRGIRELQARSVTARIGVDAWRGYCRGTEVILEFDDEAFVGGSPLMMSAVLARFFAMYTSVNSFVRLAVRRGDEVWKQWEPMSGRQLAL